MSLNLPPLPVPPAPKDTQSLATAIDTTGKSVADLAKEMAPAAILELFRIGRDPEVKDAPRVAALNAIIERAEGKVGILQDNSVNYNVIINQINRVMGAPAQPAILTIASDHAASDNH